MLKRPFLLGPVNLPEMVDACIAGRKIIHVESDSGDGTKSNRLFTTLEEHRRICGAIEVHAKPAEKHNDPEGS